MLYEMMKPFDHNFGKSGAGDLMARVAGQMSALGLSSRAAAKAIGVGEATLEKHLKGEHVRSDSAAKYRNWLEGRQAPHNVFALVPREVIFEEDPPEKMSKAPQNPSLVVDLFSGCGGLSLGFDLLGEGKYFRTILAIDNQAAPIAVLNRNAAAISKKSAGPGRQLDLTEFINASEFLAYFLEHVASINADQVLSHRLDQLSGGRFPRFRRAIAQADAAYINDLNAARAQPAWRTAWEKLDKAALTQTSVIAFHEQMRLPRSGIRPSALPAVLWANYSSTPSTHVTEAPSELVRCMEEEWDRAVSSLAARKDASGRGQLSASARRVSAFLSFLEGTGMRPLRAAWTVWRARRIELRASLFEDPFFCSELQSLYEATYPVSVLVGGPPCQGFSRIGRGKIRSLREALVHVQGHAEAGDARNLLLRQYVMVLEALRPDVFLFENVQHFQSTVKADGVEFQATEVLSEAIADLSEGAVSYKVSSRVLDASRHGVPQTRQRYFMSGVRADVRRCDVQAGEILRLGRKMEVSLGEALAGLPQPDFVGGDSIGRQEREGIVRTKGGHYPKEGFAAWVRQTPPSGETSDTVDSHLARSARTDDAAFFALMGPGKRWMDYRADDAPTINAIRHVMDVLCALSGPALENIQKEAKRAGYAFPEIEELKGIRGRVDGSLSLRLLLEQAGEKLGSSHHLLNETYLAKRDGHHGDWVARMDAGRPSKTMVSHMGKDTYGYIHPSVPRTISVREAARIQSFPDWFAFKDAALTDAFKMIGNAVPPLLSHEIAFNVAAVLHERSVDLSAKQKRRAPSRS